MNLFRLLLADYGDRLSIQITKLIKLSNLSEYVTCIVTKHIDFEVVIDSVAPSGRVLEGMIF